MTGMLQDSESNAAKASKAAQATIQGRRVALGKGLVIATRRDWKRLIKQHGGHPVDQVDGFTDVLLVNEDHSGATPPMRTDGEALTGEGLLAFSSASNASVSDAPVADASSGNTDLRRHPLEVMTEVELWQLFAGGESDVDLSRFYTPHMLAGLLDVPVTAIRRWHRRGLIAPVHQVNKLPYFDFQEIASARRIARWIQKGQSPSSIERQLEKIAEAGGDFRPLSQLSIIVRGRQVLLRAGEGLTSATGQLHFDFDDGMAFDAVDADDVKFDQRQRQREGEGEGEVVCGGSDVSSDAVGIFGDRFEQSESVVPSPMESGSGAASSLDLEADLETDEADRPQVLPFVKFEEFASESFDKSPDEFVRWATELEDDGDPVAALEVYRSMALAHGPTPDVSFRVAELLYQLGDLPAARERYYFAIELDETFVEARASLGCVLAEEGKHEMALAAFRGALDYHLNFADVHFHLARLLDEMGRADQAITHWDAFLQLAPKSPWAEEARLRLGGQSPEVIGVPAAGDG